MVKSIGLLVNEMDQRKQNEQIENDQKPQPVNKKVTAIHDCNSAYMLVDIICWHTFFTFFSIVLLSNVLFHFMDQLSFQRLIFHL